MEEGELREERGIFIRKKRFISINRIHRIDFTANVIHRLFKLVQVNIDTAGGGGGAEVSLSAIKIRDAERLREALKKEQIDVPEDDTAEVIQYPQRTISWRHLFIAGTTSGSAGVIIATIFIAFSQIQQVIPDNMYEQTFKWLVQMSAVFLIVLAVLLLALLWLFGIAGTMIKFGNFIIEKRPEELFIKRGLLETKELTIPYDRIQAVEIEQNLLRQPLKFARIMAVVAGGTDSAFPVVFPLMKLRDTEGFIKEFLPEYHFEQKAFNPLAKKGLKYYICKHAILFILALIPVLYFFPAFSWIPGIFILLSVLYALLSFKESGYLIEQHKLIFRSRNLLTKTTIITYKRRIQSFRKKQHKLQQKEHLATATFTLMSLGEGHGTLHHLTDQDVNQIADWYSSRNQLLE